MLFVRNMAHCHQEEIPCFALSRFEGASSTVLAAEGQDSVIES